MSQKQVKYYNMYVDFDDRYNKWMSIEELAMLTKLYMMYGGKIDPIMSESKYDLTNVRTWKGLKVRLGVNNMNEELILRNLIVRSIRLLGFMSKNKYEHLDDKDLPLSINVRNVIQLSFRLYHLLRFNKEKLLNEIECIDICRDQIPTLVRYLRIDGWKLDSGIEGDLSYFSYKCSLNEKWSYVQS